jgi:biopolymer transport protein ExbB/TolQ
MGGFANFFDALTGKSARHEQHRMERRAKKEAAKIEAAQKALKSEQRTEAMDEAAAKERKLMRQRAGRASTILTGSQGLGGFGTDRSPKATLLG